MPKSSKRNNSKRNTKSRNSSNRPPASKRSSRPKNTSMFLAFQAAGILPEHFREEVKHA